MDAQDVLESYARDVVRRLPSAKRNDVAFELRALLTEDLRARAAAQGQPPDSELAVRMLREFGRPAETAARYHQPFTVIEPSDTWGFLLTAIAGGFAIVLLTGPRATETYAEASWRSTVAALAWLGLLVIAFGVRSLILRRNPDAFAWRPRPVRDSDRASRVGGVTLAVLWSALLVLYLSPGRVVEALSGGRVAAAELAYSHSFTTEWRMPWLVGLLVAMIGLHLVVVAQARWRSATR